MESGARKAPFMGRQYCLLCNPAWPDQIWNLDIQNFIEQVFSRRGEVDLTLPFALCMEEAAISVSSLSSHTCQTCLSCLPTQQPWRPSDHSTLIIFCSSEKTQMLRRQMAVSDVQTAVWVALIGPDRGANRCWQLRPKDGAKISTINIFKPSLVWMISKFSLALDTHTQHSMISWTCSWPLRFVYSATF